MEWAHLLGLGRDGAAYREFEAFLASFEESPISWTKYYSYQVTMRRYEDIYGNPLKYGEKWNKS